ncbi:MAG: hypothetical protein CL910_21125 [Deltaproteobacteria bacterium]|jgi:hypothetical protein|nr:hypothetical protein [Deltaproteobacteria bacterium]
MLTLASELWEFMRVRKRFWMLPIFVMTGLLSSLIMFSQGSAVAPFVYALF